MPVLLGSSSVVISSEVFDKYMADIQAEIDQKDKASKEKAANIIKTMTDNYNLKVAERIAEELQSAEKADAVGNRALADMHWLRAEIFKSILSATQ